MTQSELIYLTSQCHWLQRKIEALFNRAENVSDKSKPSGRWEDQAAPETKVLGPRFHFCEEFPGPVLKTSGRKNCIDDDDDDDDNDDDDDAIVSIHQKNLRPESK